MDKVQTVVDRIQKTITAPSERDEQKKIGPSDLGNQCEYCLGKRMLHGSEPEFNHYAWLGTCVHLWLEQNELNPNTKTEVKGVVGTIPGYGEITGTCDRFDTDLVVGVDYKTSSVKNAKALMNGYVQRGDELKIISPQLLTYYVQIQSYGLAAANEGYDVDTVMLYIIPRDARSIRDHRWVAFDFNPEVVYAYLERAGEVYAWATEHGIESIESDPECWTCRTEGRA